MVKFRELLQDKNFFLLWFGQLISNFGDRLNQMALVALVYQRRPSSEIALATLISFTIIPVFVIGPIAGVWVDRLNRRNVMIIADILRGLLVLTIPILIFARQMLLVYAVIFLTFSLSRFFIPSKMALIPELVPKEKLLAANSLSDTTHMIGNVIGLVVAGIIVNMPAVGAIGGFYIDAATFFISASMIAFIAQKGLVEGVREDLAKTGRALSGSLRRSIFYEIKEGLRYITSHSDMHFIVQVFFILMAGIGAISCVIIVFVQNTFGTATKHLGFLGMFLVGGLFAGTVIYGKFGQKIDRRTAITSSFVLTGLMIILFAVFMRNGPNIFLGEALVALVGVTVSPIMVSGNTLTQETIPDTARGRIFSSLESVIHLAFLIFMFLSAYAAKFIDRFWVIIAVGAAFLSYGAVEKLINRK